MIAPEFTVSADDHRLVLQFDKLPMALKTNLRASITRLTDELLALVRAAEPSRTGLLRTLTRSFVDETDTAVKGRVRVLGMPGRGRHNIAAAALEYGAHRSVAVKAYQRNSIAVAAYTRRADIDAQRFLRGPAEAMQPKALAELQKAVDKSVAEVSGR